MRASVAALFFLCLYGVAAQEAYENLAETADLTALIGISVQDMIVRFGPPVAVYPVRGVETWQDDVVFEYKGADFYLFRDRVWQLSVKQANGIRIGDAKMAVAMVHGNAAVDRGSFITAAVPNRSWQIEYRYNIDARGKIQAIFVYRPDY